MSQLAGEVNSVSIELELCAICQSQIETNLTTTSCHHKFHSTCLANLENSVHQERTNALDQQGFGWDDISNMEADELAGRFPVRCPVCRNILVRFAFFNYLGLNTHSSGRNTPNLFVVPPRNTT